MAQARSRPGARRPLHQGSKEIVDETRRRQNRKLGYDVGQSVTTQWIPVSASEAHSLPQPSQGDVLVIGAGVIGVCVAHYLLAAGYRPLIVDKGGIAAGASYANAGMIVPSSWRSIAQPGIEKSLLQWITQPHRPIYAPWGTLLQHCSWWRSFLQAADPVRHEQAVRTLQRLVSGSVDLYRQLDDELNLDCQFRAQGSLSLFLSPESLRQGAAQAMAHRAGGGVAAVLDRRSVQRLVPQVTRKVAGGVLYPADGQVSPGDFVKGLAQSVARRGAEFRLHTEVLGFETEGDRVTGALTTRGAMACDQAVLATGAWSGRLGQAIGLSLPVQPAKGYSYTLPRPEGFPDMGLTLGERHVSVNPLAQTVRVAGTLEFSGLDDRLYEQRVRLLHNATQEYLGLECSPAAVEVWRGWRPMTPDGVPIIQWSPRYANLLLAIGHNKIGMTLGPMTGKLVVRVLQGQATGFDALALDLERLQVASRDDSQLQATVKAVLDLISGNMVR